MISPHAYLQRSLDADLVRMAQTKTTEKKMGAPKKAVFHPESSSSPPDSSSLDDEVPLSQATTLKVQKVAKKRKPETESSGSTPAKKKKTHKQGKLAPKDMRQSNIEEDAARQKENRKATKLEEELKKRNKAHQRTAPAGPPSSTVAEPSPDESTEDDGENQCTRQSKKMLKQMVEELDAAREVGTILPAVPTMPAAATLPGTGFHRVLMDGENLPDTNLLDQLLPEPAEYHELQPLTIDDHTLTANLTSETIECMGTISTTTASSKGPPQPPIAGKVPRPEIHEKHLYLMAEKAKQKELEEACKAALRDKDDAEIRKTKKEEGEGCCCQGHLSS